MVTHQKHQTGVRRELLDQIAEITGTEDKQAKTKQLSAPQTHTIYTKITGEKPQPFKGKAWHTRKILQETDIQCRKTLTADSSRLPADALQELLHILQQQQ